MMLPLYQIEAWNENFESAKSRLIQRCANTYAPNKHGGSGWSNVMGEADGATIWGIWKLLLDICSRQARPREGWLTADGKKNGRRLAARELSNQLRRPIEEIHRALHILQSPEVAFIKLVEGQPEYLPRTSEGQPEDTNVLSEGASRDSHATDTAVSPEYPASVSTPDIQRRIEKQNDYSLSRDSEAEGQLNDTSRACDGQQKDTAVSESEQPEDTVQHAEAKLILGQLAKDVFPEESPGAVWDNKLEHDLDEILPLRRSVLEYVDWAYRLQPSHRLFQDKGGGGMMRRRSFAALIPNLKSEASKIRDARKKIGLNGMRDAGSAMRGEPLEWTRERREAAIELYGPERELPEQFSQMPASCQREIEKKVMEVPA